MKDGIGEGYTRADHQAVANQLFSSYAKVGDARALASVIGEDELSALDKKYLAFGKKFEKYSSSVRMPRKTEPLSIPWRSAGAFAHAAQREELDRMWILDKRSSPRTSSVNGAPWRADKQGRVQV